MLKEEALASSCLMAAEYGPGNPTFKSGKSIEVKQGQNSLSGLGQITRDQPGVDARAHVFSAVTTQHEIDEGDSGR